LSELNKNAGRAVRKGLSGIRTLPGRMRVWQKAGLVLCLVSWLASALIGVLCRRTTDRLSDQAFAGRWSSGIESAQISSFFGSMCHFSAFSRIRSRAALTSSRAWGQRCSGATEYSSTKHWIPVSEKLMATGQPSRSEQQHT